MTPTELLLEVSEVVEGVVRDRVDGIYGEQMTQLMQIEDLCTRLEKVMQEVSRLRIRLDNHERRDDD